MNDTAKEVILERIYAGLPKIACKGLCTEYCGPVTVARLELKRMERVAGKLKTRKMPVLTESGQKFNGQGRLLETGTCATCVLLDRVGRCSVYGVRPILCRL